MINKKYKIVYDRAGCIGAGSCEVASIKFWKVMDDGKASIQSKDVKKADDDEETLEITETEFEENLEAAKSCPVNVIRIIDLKTGKQVYPEKHE